MKQILKLIYLKVLCCDYNLQCKLMIQFQPLNGTLQLQVHGQHNMPLFPTHHQPIMNNKKQSFLLKSCHSSLFTLFIGFWMSHNALRDTQKTAARKTTLDYTDLIQGFLGGSFHSRGMDLANSSFPVTLNACPATCWGKRGEGWYYLERQAYFPSQIKFSRNIELL